MAERYPLDKTSDVPDQLLDSVLSKPKIGKEYWVLQQHAKLIAIEGSEAVMENRWDQQFRVEISDLVDR